MKPKAVKPQARVNDLRATPFAHILIELLQHERTGTLLIYGDPGQVQAAILFQAGMPIAASVAQETESRNLSKVLIPLCAWREGDFLFAEERNLVGPSAVVAPAALDPLPLIAAAARGPLRDDAVEATLADIGANLLKLSPRVDRSRFAFTAQEQPVIDCLEAGALDLDALREQSAVPERVLRRVVYVLRLSRAITLLPAARRMVSGTIAHASPLPGVVLDPPSPRVPAFESLRPSATPAQRAPAPAPAPRESGQVTRASIPAAPALRSRPAPAMRSAVGGGRYSMHEPEHGTSALAAEGEDVPLGRAEAAEELWRRVDGFVAQREYAPALLLARNAAKLALPSAEREALTGWLLFLHGGPNGRVHPQVWDHFDRAFKREPLCAQAHYYKALVLRRSGEPEQAHLHFKRALSIAPGHMDAAREVRLYRMREEHARQQAGFLQKLLAAKSNRKPDDRKR
jgi:tetratricopeptide (TPR) repeat protein